MVDEFGSMSEAELERELVRLQLEDAAIGKRILQTERQGLTAVDEALDLLDGPLSENVHTHHAAGDLRRVRRTVKFRLTQLAGAADEPPEVQPVPESRTVRALAQRFTDRLRWADQWSQPPHEFTRILRSIVHDHES